LSLAVPTRRVTSQSFLKGLGKTFVHKSFPKSFFENHSMGQALATVIYKTILPIQNLQKPVYCPWNYSMMSDKIILSVDQGSSHTRAVLFTDHGKKLYQSEVPLCTYYPGHGRIEHDPKELLKSTFTAIRAVLRKSGIKKIATMGITNQRSTVLCWDRHTGAPLSPAISWQSGFGYCGQPAFIGHGGKAKEEDFLTKWADPSIQEKTGLPLTCHYSATKLNGLLNQIGRKRKNLVAGTVNTFLIWHLTRGKSHFTDPTNAQRMLLYNLTRQEWDTALLRHFNIPENILPTILPNQASFGEAIIDGVCIPITASIGDQQSSLIGLGGLEVGAANVNYGTGGFFLINTGQKRLTLHGLLVSIACSDKNKTTYLVEGTVNTVGTLFTWLQQIGILKSIAEIDLAYRRSKESVFFLPALTGLGAPYWKSEATGALFGLTAATQREDIIRGAVDGIAYLMNDIYQRVPDTLKKQIKTIIATGGGAKISSLMQFQADILDKTLSIATDIESTVRGVAFLAGVKMGLTDETRFCFSPIRKKIIPQMKSKERARLTETWQAAIFPQ